MLGLHYHYEAAELLVSVDVMFVCLFFFQANIGQDEDFEAARAKAVKLGAKKVKKIKNCFRKCFCGCGHIEAFVVITGLDLLMINYGHD